MMRRMMGSLLALTMHPMHDLRFYTHNRCCAVIPALSPRVATVVNSNRNYQSPVHTTLHIASADRTRDLVRDAWSSQAASES